ncbi:MAG: hypothetical protein ACREPE_16485, partial [Lysobacter sp.]
AAAGQVVVPLRDLTARRDQERARCVAGVDSIHGSTTRTANGIDLFDIAEATVPELNCPKLSHS